jgi:hypothetical protein
MALMLWRFGKHTVRLVMEKNEAVGSIVKKDD